MKNFAITIGLLLALIVALYYASPVFRTRVNAGVGSLTDWSQEAIAADPVGYTVFVENNLKEGLKTSKNSLRELTLGMEEMSKMLLEMTEDLSLAEKCTVDFGEAIVAGVYPVSVHGAEYLERQLRNQLALSLAQADSLKSAIAEITTISETAENEILRTVLEIENFEAQIKLLAMRRAVFEAQKSRVDSDAMIATAKSAIQGHQARIKVNNPVRTLKELKEDISRIASSTSNGAPATATQVDMFLREFAAKKSAGKSGSLQSKGIPPAPGDRDE